MRRFATVLIVLAMIVPAGGVPATAAATTAGPPPVTITLITGDRVTLGERGAMSVAAGPGRRGVGFVGWRSQGHRYVVPADALAGVRSGRLDRRLFDVTLLRELGYTGPAALPLLIAYPKNNAASAKAALRGTTRLDRDLGTVGLLAARVEHTERDRFWSEAAAGPGIERIFLDGRRKLQLDVSVPQIGAPAAWQAGYDGSGVTVAVLDSGIDATHPDFTGRLGPVRNFTTDPSADDLVGHGTHVASTIAGTGTRSGGRYRGVAPGATLAIGKVCVLDECPESAVLAGMEWAARNASVINMSLGGWDTLGVDPLEQAVEDLTAEYGALFVIAAGNDGRPGTISPLGNAPSALTVGAVDDQDRLAPFSSRGPRLGDDAIKPDITAPGVGIVAAGAAHGRIGTPAGDGYVSLNGTSMAAPHVAGAAAILTQRRPGWSAAQRKAMLMGAAVPAAGVDAYAQGAGRVDVARAVRQEVSAEEGSVSFGRQEWPHADDVPVTRTVTYTNASSTPVTLSLALHGDPGFTLHLSDDNTAPPGPFRIPATLEHATTLAAESSLDDGRTWHPAAVHGTGPHRVLRIDNPASGFVSLRLTAGNAVLTVLRAYQVSAPR